MSQWLISIYFVQIRISENMKCLPVNFLHEKISTNNSKFVNILSIRPKVLILLNPIMFFFFFPSGPITAGTMTISKTFIININEGRWVSIVMVGVWAFTGCFLFNIVQQDRFTVGKADSQVRLQLKFHYIKNSSGIYVATIIIYSDYGIFRASHKESPKIFNWRVPIPKVFFIKIPNYLPVLFRIGD